MNILGLHSSFSCHEHDPSAALVRDGDLLALCEEERLVGVKNAKGHLPINSIKACLREARISIRDIDLIVHTGDCFPERADMLARYLRHYFGFVPPIEIINHQLAHLASAFFHSGFHEAMCLSCDGYGDRLSGALAVANSDGIRVIETLDSTNSIGVFYSLITSYLGFTVDRDEYKIMGLSAYGREGVEISDVLAVTNQGYAFDTNYLTPDYKTQNMYEPYYSDKLINLLGPPRAPGSEISQRHKDVAYAAQMQLEECLIALVTHLRNKTEQHNLCLAGGVALNCKANYRLSELDFVENIFVQPASSDRGIALGCALYGAHSAGTPPASITDACKGPTYTTDDIRQALESTGARYFALDDPATRAAQMLDEGKILAWYQGRSEFGPRALGHRSILADPRPAKMKDEVNKRIKYREEFRPFAPSVMADNASELFVAEFPSPFMTVSFPVRPEWRDRLNAVVHADNSSRIQTVDQQVDSLYYRLIEEFWRLSGVPAVLNTSFNVRSQPIVETPLQALATYASTGLDALFIDHFVVAKHFLNRIQ